MISEKSKRFDSEYTDEQGGRFANRALWEKKKKNRGLRCVLKACDVREIVGTGMRGNGRNGKIGVVASKQ